MSGNQSASGGASPPTPCGEWAENLPDDCRTVTLGVAFFDLSRMTEWSSSNEDVHVASFLQAFYALAAKHVGASGGRIVKFMGDAGLAVWAEDDVERGVFALADFAREARACGREYGLDTYLNVNVHAGAVLAGSFGPAGAEHYDVIGKTVNIAARLGRRGLTLSQQAYRCLSPGGRQRFEKFTPPTTYRLRR